MRRTAVGDYLDQSRVTTPAEDAKGVQLPPTQAEVKGLLEWLTARGLAPVLVGGAAVVAYLPASETFRPTVDVDIYVAHAPTQLMPGWRKDPQAIGLPSWIAPSGGVVDFLVGGHEFPGGKRVPKDLQGGVVGGFPVADWRDLFYLKLGTGRPKDFSDLLSLCGAIQQCPTSEQIGRRLSREQREDLNVIRMWWEHQGARGQKPPPFVE